MATDDYPTDIVIAEWPRSNREVFRVQLHRFQGRPVFSWRVWYRNAHGELCPGRDGVTTGLHHLPLVLDAFVEAYRIACARGLIDPDSDNAVS